MPSAVAALGELTAMEDSLIRLLLCRTLKSLSHMPGIFYQPIGRRTFLYHSAKALAATVLLAPLERLSRAAPASGSPLHLALLSDTHVAADPKNENRKFFPTENLKQVVTQVIAARPGAGWPDGAGGGVAGV